LPSTAVQPKPSRSGSRGQKRGCAVHGLGTALPDRVVTNASIAERLGVDEDWIVQRVGVQRRRMLAEGERLSDLAALAARRALEDAAVDPSEIDLVIAASFTQDELIPTLAPVVAADLGAPHVGAFDVVAICTGFLAALGIGAAQIEADRADTVLVIGADALSRHHDHADPRTAPLFADGAGAVILRADEQARLGPSLLWSDIAGASLIQMDRQEQIIHMEGPETYRFAVAALTDATRSVLESAELEIADVDLFVYHQANARILTAVADRLQLEERQRVDYIAETGNTSAASIPLALGSLAAEGRLHPGCRLLLGAIGGGFIWGASLLEWGAGGRNGKNSS
jgi:3-oxoacyl-[acyl-carrier-protein] synthase-3